MVNKYRVNKENKTNFNIIPRFKYKTQNNKKLEINLLWDYNQMQPKWKINNCQWKVNKM